MFPVGVDAVRARDEGTTTVEADMAAPSILPTFRSGHELIF